MTGPNEEFDTVRHDGEFSNQKLILTGLVSKLRTVAQRMRQDTIFSGQLSSYSMSQLRLAADLLARFGFPVRLE